MRILSAMIVLAPGFAFAQAADATSTISGGSPYASMLPLVAIFFVFYFLLIKPQQRRMKEHQAMQGALKKGDEVVTAGGIVGKITKAGEGDRVTVEIAKAVEVVVLKSTISSVVGASSPAVTSAKKNSAVKNDNVLPGKDQIANDN